jgi:putative ABC transport system permease protein
MTALWQDIRYGVRVLWKRPGFTLVAVAALALGVGANTAIFSVVNAVLIRPLPYAEPERLVRVHTTDLKRGILRYPTSYPNFSDWREQASVFERVGAHASTGAAVTFGDTPEAVEGVYVTADVLPLLGVGPLHGRVFTPEDERPGSRVAIISHGLWQRRFNGDPAIVGRQILFDGEGTTVVGVMPEGFKFPFDVEGPEYWAPLNPETEANRERGYNYLSVVARLRPGVTREQAQAEMETIMGRLQEEHSDKNAGRGANVFSMHEDAVGELRPALLTLLAAVSFILLIACANVANLLLARAATRRKEFAIRTALGASRLRVARQLLTESLLLALAGGGLGLVLALWGVEALGSLIPADIPRVKETGLDSQVLLFTLGVSVLTGVVFGLFPALSASQADLNETLKEGARGSTEGFGRNRVRGLLVVSEVALSLILLVGAGLLIRSFLELRALKTGFDPQNVLTASIALPTTKYADEPRQAAFQRQTLERVAQLPGVKAVGGAEPLPFSGNGWQTGLRFHDRPPAPPGERLTAHTRVVTPDYFRAMGIPLIRGRVIAETDGENAPKVIVINETFAKKYFPGEDPLGKRVTPTLAQGFDAEVVGVVADSKHRRLDEEAAPEYYASYQQAPQPILTLVVRAEGDAAALANAVRGAVLEIDPNQPVYGVKTMEEWLSESVARRRFNMLLLTIFAAVALLLAAVGIFGVMNYTVTRRTHEIGVRMALGAQGADIRRLVVGQGMALALAGIAAGLVGAFALTRLMTSLLYGVHASDPLTFAVVALLLGAVALLSCYLPARRATRVDPMVALRYE